MWFVCVKTEGSQCHMTLAFGFCTPHSTHTNTTAPMEWDEFQGCLSARSYAQHLGYVYINSLTIKQVWFLCGKVSPSVLCVSWSILSITHIWIEWCHINIRSQCTERSLEYIYHLYSHNERSDCNNNTFSLHTVELLEWRHNILQFKDEL